MNYIIHKILIFIIKSTKKKHLQKYNLFLIFIFIINIYHKEYTFFPKLEIFHVFFIK